jgi:ABC-type branched-subunit amino acid transport system substrate-binding protein
VRLKALALALSLAAVAARSPSAPDVIDRAATLGARDRAQGIALIETYLKGKHEPVERAWAMLWAGEQRRLAGDDAEARTWFVTLLDQFPTDRRKQGAVVGMALLDAKVSLSGNTLATLGMVGEDDLPATMNADRFRLLARVAIDDGSPDAEVQALVKKALDYAAADPTVLARVKASLADFLSKGAKREATVAKADDPASALARARAALEAKDTKTARELAASIQGEWPDSPEATAAVYLQRVLDAAVPVDGDKVAVLLPLSGDWAATGGRIKEVVELANERAGRPMELVFADTQGKPDVAVSKLEDLAISKGAVAVLGPLLKDEAIEAGKVAEAIGVPMVSLSQNQEVTAAGPHVYRGFLSVEEQIRALLDEAVGARGMTRFAILYPLTPYGEAARDLFASGAQAKGASIARAIGYAEDSKDFLKVAQDLGEKSDPARAAEWAQARSAARRDGEDLHKATIAPKADFDAIFIPDNHRRVPLVASALAYEEFPVGAFRPRRDDRPIVLLGLNAWDQESFPRDGGKYVQDCLFVDAFYARDADTAVASFVADYESRFHRSPQVVDAVAYDAARLLGAAVEDAGGTRTKLLAALGKARIAGPVAGGESFGADRAVARRLKILTVRQDRVELALPPGMDGVAPLPEPEAMGQ